jgi:hypothetical protein
MSRVAWTVLCVACAGCGLVSGLDSLAVGDAGNDVAPSSDGGADGASSDAATEGLPADGGMTVEAATCPYTAGALDCFGEGCGADCCVTDAGLHCLAGSTCSGAEFQCTNPSQCGGATTVCCLQGATGGQPACPRALITTTSTIASCVPSGSCDSAFRLCASDSDCNAGTTCHASFIDVDPGAILGVCAVP